MLRAAVMFASCWLAMNAGVVSRLAAQRHPARLAHLDGVVIDSAGQPVSFAHVTVVPSALGPASQAHSDRRGRFHLLVPDTGRVVVHILCMGYAPSEVEVVRVRGRTQSLRVALRRVADTVSDPGGLINIPPKPPE